MQNGFHRTFQEERDPQKQAEFNQNTIHEALYLFCFCPHPIQSARFRLLLFSQFIALQYCIYIFRKSQGHIFSMITIIMHVFLLIRQ